jgi:alkanesulfonate monooxygenase SsuD/methylene tetrahydromethanopterin reductase-like flavin-dependent oxidoreductase (luciferase family)
MLPVLHVRVICRAGGGDVGGMRSRPGDQGRRGVEQRHAKRGQLVVNPRRDHRVDGPAHQAVALAAAATATTRVKLGFGVLVLPLRPVAWTAKMVASLQHVSSGRVILGAGTGGERHAKSWEAAGVPRRDRGRRTDAALRVLPGLIAGQAVRLGGGEDGPLIRLSPAAPVPPVIVGGMSDAALARAARYGDGWFSMLAEPGMLAGYRARLAGMAAALGRPARRSRPMPWPPPCPAGTGSSAC